MINIFKPNAEQLARGVALNLAFRFGMQTAKPFDVSKFVGKDKNPELLDLGALEGRTWLTSLALKHGGKEFIFNECLISLNMEKNIVTTALQGRNGTIKEYISDGDYNITIDAGVSTYEIDKEEGYSHYPSRNAQWRYNA